jgi:hypothetical protein
MIKRRRPTRLSLGQQSYIQKLLPTNAYSNNFLTGNKWLVAIDASLLCEIMTCSQCITSPKVWLDAAYNAVAAGNDLESFHLANYSHTRSLAARTGYIQTATTGKVTTQSDLWADIKATQRKCWPAYNYRPFKFFRTQQPLSTQLPYTTCKLLEQVHQ